MRERRSFIIFFLVLAFTSQCSAQNSPTDLVCNNDGYYSEKNNCTCTTFFGDVSCSSRICLNDGSPRNKILDQGCYCPSGYMTQNCETARCAQETPATFAYPSERVLALFIPYNIDFSKKINTARDDPVQAMCEVFIADSSYNVLIFYFSSSANMNVPRSITTVPDCLNKFNQYLESSCMDDDDNLIDCQNSHSLSTADVSLVIDKLPSRSRLYVISNLLPNGTESDSNLAVRKAISKRIVINSIFYEQAGTLMAPAQYNKERGYQIFRNLAEGTLGNFITPYSGVDNALLATTDVKTSVSFLEQMSTDGYGPVDAHLETESQLPTTVNVGSDYYYIIFRILNGNGDQKPIFASPPDHLELYLNTGFWLVYRAKNNESIVTTTFLTDPSGSKQYSYYVHSKVRLETFTSVTTTADVDASSPFAVQGSSRSLVANIKRLPNSNAEFTIQKVYFKGGVTFSQRISRRDNCIFSTFLGDIQCGEVGIMSLVIRDADSIASVTPFMCADKTSDAAQMIMFQQEDDENGSPADNSDISIEDVQNLESEGAGNILLQTANQSKSFALVLNDDGDLINTVLVQPNSIIQQLVAYIKGNGMYDKYYYNIFSSDSYKATKEFTSFDDFITSLMNDVHTPSATKGSPLPVWESLDSMYTKMISDFAQFSDIFLFVNCKIGTPDTRPQLEAKANSLRSRLFVTSYEDTSYKLSDDDFQEYKKLVEKTGGSFIHTSDASDIQLKFLPFYFNNVVGGFTLYQKVASTSVAPFLSSSIFANNEKQDISVVVQLPVGHVGPSSVAMTLNNVAMNVTSINEYWHATSVTAVKGENALKISFIPPCINASFAVYTKQNTIYTTTAFSTSKDVDFSYGDLKYGSNSYQYPIVASSGSPKPADETVQLAIYDSSFALIRKDTISSTRADQTYKYFLNYSFVCTNQDDIYYFETALMNADSSTLSRAYQTFVCVKTSDCLNGGTPVGLSDRSCICVVGFIGDNCEKRACQNKGTLLPDGLCSCADGFSGDFCEINPHPCVKDDKELQQTAPDIRSSIDTVIFVADAKTAKDMADKATFNYGQLNGKQLIVASCIDNTPTVLSTTTYANDLNMLFNKVGSDTSSDPNYNCLLKSLVKAMTLQTSKRGIVFVLTDSGNWNFDADVQSSIQNLFASGRFDLRIKTAKNDYSVQLKQLAKRGNGIPFSSGSTQDYVNNYILTIIPKLTTKPSQSMSVIESSMSQSSKFEYSFKAGKSSFVTKTNNLIIHAASITELTVNVNGKAAPLSLTVGDDKNKINIYKVNPNDLISVSITGDSYMYSIEVMTTAKLAFGFQNQEDADANSEYQLNLGAHPSNYILNFYISNEVLSDVAPSMTFVEVRSFDQDEKEMFLTQLPVTRKTDPSCLYPSYTDLKVGWNSTNFCSSGEVYILRLRGTDKSNNSPFQIQKTLSCFAPRSSDDCYHGSSNGQECACKSRWYGTDCSYPVCDGGNTKYSSKLVCGCSSGAIGPYCQAPDKIQRQALSFIIDITGYSDYLYDVQIDAIKRFVTSYNMNELLVSVVGNDPTSSKSQNVLNKAIGTVADFLAILDSFKAIRTKTDLYQDISGAYSVLLNKATNPAATNIFAITQRTYTVSDMTAFNKFNLSGSQILYFGLGTVYNPFSTVNDMFDDMKKTSSDGTFHEVNNVDDLYSSMIGLSNLVPDATSVDLPPLTPPSCINSLVSNVAIQVDVSSIPESAVVRQTLNEFLGIIRDDFNTKPLTPNKEPVNVTNYQWKNKASVSSIIYYDKYFYNPAFGTISFCGTDDTQLRKTMLTVQSKASTPDYPSTMRYAETFYNSSLQCARFDVDNVKHITIWIPMSENLDDYRTIDKASNAHYYHLVLPYNFDIKFNSMFYSLAESSYETLGPPKDGKAVTDMFMDKWTKDTTAVELKTRVYEKLKELFLTDC